ncbi:MAG: hypothetical protein H7836_16060, partial [Magnetococcus sp. YQC-3]
FAYIPHKDITEWWGFGHVNFKSLTRKGRSDIKKVTNYLTKYISKQKKVRKREKAQVLAMNQQQWEQYQSDLEEEQSSKDEKEFAGRRWGMSADFVYEYVSSWIQCKKPPEGMLTETKGNKRLQVQVKYSAPLRRRLIFRSKKTDSIMRKIYYTAERMLTKLLIPQQDMKAVRHTMRVCLMEMEIENTIKLETWIKQGFVLGGR